MAQPSPAESPYESPDTQMEEMAHGLPDFNPEKSPRFGNLGFLKGLTERKTTRGRLAFGFPLSVTPPSGADDVVDGQAPKRRGPKPDSKPALTRRQELNRQAQR